MTGHMFASDLNLVETHTTTLVAASDGVLACVPLGELKIESRRQPEATFMVQKVAAKYAMETFLYNLYGKESNPLTKHPPTAQMTKTLRDFYMKNEKLREFMKGVERRDEKFIINTFVNSEFEPGEKVMAQGAMDRSVLFVAQGSLITFTDRGENRVYETGSILGCEQFLHNTKWPSTYICG